MPDPAPVDPLSVEIRDAIGAVIDTITDQAHEHLCACLEWPDSCGYLYTRVGLEPVGAEQALEVAVRMGWTPPAAEPAQAGEDTTFHAGQVVRWQFMRRPESEWFTACLDDVHPTGGHDWHGVVVDPGTYPDTRSGDDMWLMEDCLTLLPTAPAEPAQAGEDTVWRVESVPPFGQALVLVGDLYRDQSGWLEMRDAGGAWVRSGWDDLGEMRDAGYVLTEVPAVTAEDGDAQR